MNKYDLYIGKEIMCICGLKCDMNYTVISDVYEKDDDEVFNVHDENGNIEIIYVDYLDEYTVI